MIFDYIVEHQNQFWLALGFCFLVIEVITGFTTGIFLFAGLGGLVCGALMSIGVLPETWIAGVAGTGISTGVITWLLWKPLKKLQGDKPLTKDNSSDLVGHEFNLESDIGKGQVSTTHYSGISWKVELDHNSGVDFLESGRRVAVSSVEVGLFKVRPV